MLAGNLLLQGVAGSGFHCPPARPFYMSKYRRITKTEETVAHAETLLHDLVGEKPTPELVLVAQEFFTLIGGPKKFAMMLKRAYDHAPKGGMVQVRILDLMVNALKYLTPKEDITDDCGLLSDQDLEREIQKQFSKALPNGQPPGRPEPARSAPATAAPGAAAPGSPMAPPVGPSEPPAPG